MINKWEVNRKLDNYHSVLGILIWTFVNSKVDAVSSRIIWAPDDSYPLRVHDDLVEARL